MNATELEKYIKEHIPLSQHIELEVSGISDRGILLKAPKAPNKNHKNTAFGGSQLCLAAICAWSLARKILDEHQVDAEIVIKNGTSDFLRPIHSDFFAECKTPPAEEVQAFLDRIRNGKNGHIDLVVQISSEGKLCTKFKGVFVGLAP